MLGTILKAVAGPLVGGLVKGGFSALGQKRANEESEESAERSMAFSADQAQINRDWQMEMSNTRYQRTMDDMKSAGLNPILAYQQGGGPVPGGAQGQGAQYTAGNIGRDIGDLGVTSAVQGARVGLEAKRQKELLHQMRSVTTLNNERARTEAANQNLIREQAKNIEEQMPSHSAQREMWKSTTAVNQLEKEIRRAEAQIRKAGAISAKETQKIYNTAYGRFLRWVDETGRALNPFASAGQSAAGARKTLRTTP